jgi:hypothetical protein
MHEGGCSRSRLLAVAATAALLCVGAGSALAGLAIAPLEPGFSRTTVKKDRHASTSAKCRGGNRVVSGGFAAPDRAYAGGGPYTEILAAARKGGDGFVVKAQNFSSRDGKLYAYAYCGNVGRIKVAEDSTEVGDRKDGTATAHCPDGLTAVSGGWYGKAPNGGRPEFIPFLSKRAGTDGWKVSAENADFEGSAILVAQAYCADVDPPSVAVTDRRMETLSQPRAAVSCKGGREAIAGGFDAATPKGYSTGAEIYSSRRTGGGGRWKIAGINGGRERHLRVYAYCV